MSDYKCKCFGFCWGCIKKWIKVHPFKLSIWLFIALAVAIPLLFTSNLWLSFFSSNLAGFLMEGPSQSVVPELTAYLAILTILVAVLTVAVAYSTLDRIGENERLNLIWLIDERWVSKEITEVRKDLWQLYSFEKKKLEQAKTNSINQSEENFEKNKNNKDPCMDLKIEDHIAKNVKQAAKEAVQNRILAIDGYQDKSSLFKHLNFIELLGTIGLLNESGKIKDDELQTLFSGHIKTYLGFYEKYLKDEPDRFSNARKLLERMEEFENKKTGN